MALLYTLFVNTRILVEANDSGEIFITARGEPKARIKVGSYMDWLLITSQDGHFNPTESNGLGGFIVKGGKG